MSSIMRIAVRYTRRPGPNSGLLIECSPTIDVMIGYDPLGDRKDAGQPPGIFVPVRALIDSGADEIIVDKEILQQCGCPRVGSIMVKSPHGIQEHEKFRAQMFFADSGFKSEVEVISHDLRDGMRVYDAIFGTRFLEFGILVLNPSGESYFSFNEPMTAKSPKTTSGK
jgi:hypothetical protein